MTAQRPVTRQTAGSATRWTPWNRTGTPPGRPDRLRVYCLPHAGGSAAQYLPWLKHQGADGPEIVPVELPGRGPRFLEDPFADLDGLVSSLVDELFAPLPDRSFALFGHSMGAYLGYEVTRRLAEGAGPAPAQLVVSGARPPGAPPAERLDDLDDAALLESIAALGGTPPEVLERPDLLELVLPVLRADLTVVRDFYDNGRPVLLPCPVTVFGGEADHLAGPQWLAGWRDVTAGRFAVKVFPGGHFYLHDHAAQVLRELTTAVHR